MVERVRATARPSAPPEVGAAITARKGALRDIEVLAGFAVARATPTGGTATIRAVGASQCVPTVRVAPAREAVNGPRPVHQLANPVGTVRAVATSVAREGAAWATVCVLAPQECQVGHPAGPMAGAPATVGATAGGQVEAATGAVGGTVRPRSATPQLQASTTAPRDP